MAQAHLKWDQLPARWQDITAFLPRIATIMGATFRASDGYYHQTVGQTEYRVRQGFFHGLDVRVWRQGDELIINVSPGSRLGSSLPVIATILAGIGTVMLEQLAGEFGMRLPYRIVPRKSTYLLLAVGTVLFLILWAVLALVTRPFVGQMKQGCDPGTILAEIQRGLAPE